MVAVQLRCFSVLFAVCFTLLSGWSPSLGQSRLDGVVVTDHDDAVRAGMEILEQGGNAVDAAVATAFSLAVVDPALSGLGGGGVMVVYRPEEKKAYALDFTAVSPAAAPALYRADSQFYQNPPANGVLAVAVPGTVAGLAEALKRFGRLPLETVLLPAIRYAAEGFRVTLSLRRIINDNLPFLQQRANFSRIFLDADGVPLKVGKIVRQPELAETLRSIARDGATAFYEGAVAQAIAARMTNDNGAITLGDLNSYRPVWRRPVIGNYRGRTVITVPPPSAGGLVLVGSLNVMEGYGPDQFRHNSGAYLHLVAETMKAGTTDLLKYLGDPDSNEVPVQRIVSMGRATSVGKQISLDAAAHRPVSLSAAHVIKNSGTRYIGVLDGDSNAVSMNVAIGSPFGSGVLVREIGIILNNQIQNFALRLDSGTAIENAPNMLKPRKRPVNGMTPTILLNEDRPVLIIGASGGSQTASAILQTILNVLDFRMPLTSAVDAPRVHVPVNSQQTVEVEFAVGRGEVGVLEKRGHVVRRKPQLGSVQAIRVEGKNIIAVADPRKPGVVR